MVAFCKVLTEDSRFQTFIMFMIVLTALVVGLETSPSLMQAFEGGFLAFNATVQSIFVAEILLRILAHWPRPHRFFSDGWNLFDFAVIAGSLLPTLGTFAVVARVARLLRVARLVSIVPELRVIVETMIRSIPAIANVMLLLAVLLYVYAVLGYHIFSDADPQRWGSLGTSAITLFKVLTLEGWVDIYDTVTSTHTWAWVYFGSFILIAVFVMINLFVAVILESMDNVRREGLVSENPTSDIEQLLGEARLVLDRLETALRRTERS